MLYLLAIVFILYSGIIAYMAAFQRRMLYLPEKQVGAPEQYGLSGFKEGFIKTSDGLSLQIWYRPAQRNMPTILYFHGNASHIGNRSGIYSALAGKGFGVLALSYRGYGKSEGSPSEQGLYADGRAAISFLTESQNIPANNILIYGESLGTGVGVQIAGEYPVGGLILQAPYTSIVNRAAEIYFYIPVKLVMLDRFDSIGKIKLVRSPLLIIHGEQDETIPKRHGETLFAVANSPKHSVFFPDAGHNNFDSSAIAGEVLNFANKYGPAPAQK